VYQTKLVHFFIVIKTKIMFTRMYIRAFTRTSQKQLFPNITKYVLLLIAFNTHYLKHFVIIRIKNPLVYL
jgi:hypothetical protein